MTKGFKEIKGMSGKSDIHSMNKIKSQTKTSKVKVKPSNKIVEFDEGNYINLTPILQDSEGEEYEELYDDLDVSTSLDYADSKTIESLAKRLEKLASNLRKIDKHITKIKSAHPDLKVYVNVDMD